MSKNPNRHGGGARTNANGLYFEQTTSLNDALNNAGYTVREYNVYYADNLIGKSVPKRSLYTQFLEKNGINYTAYNSKRWEPDEAFINLQNNTAYIIEKKFQNTSGSVDEKLPGCDFKKGEYCKLFYPIGFTVEYLYLFNDWFKCEKYSDVLEYIKQVGCHYFFNSIPLDFLGLPTKK